MWIRRQKWTDLNQELEELRKFNEHCREDHLPRLSAILAIADPESTLTRDGNSLTLREPDLMAQLERSVEAGERIVAEMRRRGMAPRRSGPDPDPTNRDARAYL